MKEVVTQERRTVMVVTYGEDIEGEWFVQPICCQVCCHRWVAVLERKHLGLGIHCPMCRVKTIFTGQLLVPSA